MDKLIKIILLVAGLSLVLLTLPMRVNAQYSAKCCDTPIVNPKCIVLFGERPENCVETYCKNVEPEYRDASSCSSRISLTDDNGVDNQVEELIDVNIFGISMRFNSDRAIVQMIYLGFTSFLAAGALVAAFTGVMAAIRRANAETDDAIAESSKMVMNALIGFGLMLVSLVIVQIVASVIGAGNLFQIVQLPSLLPTF